MGMVKIPPEKSIPIALYSYLFIKQRIIILLYTNSLQPITKFVDMFLKRVVIIHRVRQQGAFKLEYVNDLSLNNSTCITFVKYFSTHSVRCWGLS